MADDDKKDHVSAWQKATKRAGNESSVQNALLKNAMALNPALKKGRKTEEVLDELRAAKKAAAERGEKEKAAPQAAHKDLLALPMPNARADLAGTLSESKAWLEAEVARTDRGNAVVVERRQVLEQERAKSTAGILGDVVKLLRQVDPSLGSPVTQSLLNEHAEFLRKIGFDKRALVGAK